MATIANDGPYFYGTLVQDDDLDKVERERINQYEEELASHSELRSRSADGWEVKKQIKDKIIFKKKKSAGELLENEVWLLFKNMGFKEMNKDRNFKIQAGVNPKQIDVFAKDDNNIFVIECKTGTPSLSKDILEILQLRRNIKDSIRKKYEKDYRISFILVTKNINWTENEEKLAMDNEKNLFFFWKEDELEAYETLVDQLGYAAKYQLFGILFGNKEASEVGEIKVPAMRGGKGNKYYLFLMQPEKLFKIAYVHRREKSSPKEVGKAYQRMISKQRIEKIGEFIDNGNQFPNNIILNFDKKPVFEPNPKIKEISGITYGILKFPPYYGCAWVIDGQHRLYGYSKSKHLTDPKHTIPVIAFESLKVKEQANLFVNINENQKSVNQNLLWELYPDIYDGSEEEDAQILRSISLIVQKLNSDENSVFFNRIQIPSILTKDKKTTNLTLTNLCEAIKENRLINEEENLLYKENYEDTINFAAERIGMFFEVITNFLHDDWQKGDNGLLRTNVGIRIFSIILRQVLRYLKHKGMENIYKKYNLNEFQTETKKILEAVLTNLKKMDDYRIDEIRKGSTKDLVLKNTQMLLWDLKEGKIFPGFGAELWKEGRGWSPPIPNEESDEGIKKLVKDTEINTKKFIIEKLKEIHREKWWDDGIPQGVKQNIDKTIEQELSKSPFEREKINSYSNEKKFFNYSSTADIKEVIKYGNNWSKLSRIFGDAEYMSSHFKSLENVRNAFIGHEERKEDVDIIIKNLGYWGTKWIRRCIGLDEIEIIT